MKVLDGDLSEDGDDLLTNEWAATFMENGKTVLLAFRCGNRTVRVQEFSGFQLIRKKQIVLAPYVP